jgi:hypothetical protein
MYTPSPISLQIFPEVPRDFRWSVSRLAPMLHFRLCNESQPISFILFNHELGITKMDRSHIRFIPMLGDGICLFRSIR